ncbi:MAG: CHC2 zinc finger domain-containing protein [Solirubrobacteraceae bacterium MAG38_C4-C5]|nr:CHC2 zinc finger domain-containing protein [Candidatus Siliceabacter maunaloa]
MARVPEEEIERLKEEISLERLVEAFGVELHKQGSDLVGRCPFHEDRTPSLVVTPHKNLWHCMGACDRGGSPIDWVMAAEGVSFRHAVELLRDGVAPSMGPVAARTAGARPARSTVAKLPSPLERAADDRELLGRVVSFYAQTLRESAEALAYLERRGLRHPELIERFRLGYANRTLGYRLPARNRQAGAQLRGRLQRLGVLRDSGHEHLSGSLVIPVLDEHGQVVQLYGRKIRSDLRPGTPLHLYLPGSHRGVFNRPGIEAAAGEVVLCESLIDALSFWVHGQRHVTAAYGTQGFSAEHLAALKANDVSRVLIAFDRDEAGDAAAVKLATRLAAEGIDCFRAVFPAGQDANGLATSAEDPDAALAEVLRAAAWMGQGRAPARTSPAAVATAPASAAPAPAEREAPAGGGEEEELAGEPPSAAVPVSAAEAPASPLPAGPAAGPAVRLEGEELHVVLDDRRWRVRGLARVTSFEVLRVNVLVARDDERRGHVFHVDSLDLYSARARGVFCRQAADEFGLAEELVARDLGRVLMVCEERAEEVIRAAQEPARPEVALTDSEREAALGLLTDPGLVDRAIADFAAAGIVGEQVNCLVGYLAAVSRKLDRPLAVIVQSTSAAGKSALQDAVLGFVPAEERVSFSAMTGQSLFYMGESDLQHKVLAVAEEEGAERAAYALKLLQSEGELRIASTGKDGTTGRLVTHTYRVSGPVAIFLTTTAVDVDEELLNRCVVLTVDEDRAQTQAIHARQRERETLDGLIADRRRREILKLHQDAQRLLEPLAVVNPYATRLAFSDAQTRTRRDHLKYLTLIRAIALLHQHQRPRKSASVEGRQVVYIEATADDVRLANRLAHRVLGRSLDELAPGARRLLDLFEQLVAEHAARDGVARERVEFTRRQLREHLALGDTQLKVHLARLVSLELIHMTRGAHGAYTYTLAWTSDDAQAAGAGGALLPGLIDPDHPGEHDYDDQPDPDRSAPLGDRSGAGRPPVGPRSGSATTAAPDQKLSSNGASAATPGGSVGPEPEQRFPDSSFSAASVTVAAQRAAG